MNKPSAIQLALNKLHEAMEGMAKDAKGWKVSDISALNGVTKEIVNIKKELAESQQELTTLKASLPKIKADAVHDFSDWMCDRLRYDFEGPRDLDSVESFIDIKLEEYTNKLEAGE